MNQAQSESQAPNLKLAKRLNIAVYVISAAVLLLVGAMRQVDKFELPEGWSLAFLPAVHATLNTIVSVSLIVALVMVKRGNISGHKFAINFAMCCSAAFLLCYVAYHFTTEETTFGGSGIAKTIYLVLLITHITSAALSFPFILYTWVLGFTGQFARHRKFAKFVFPIWLYVAVTGPVCYFMLRPYYGS